MTTKSKIVILGLVYSLSWLAIGIVGWIETEKVLARLDQLVK